MEQIKNEIPKGVYEVEIKYKRPVFDTMPKIDSSSSANDLIHEYLNGHSIGYKEYFFGIFLTNANMVLCISEISKGSANATVVNTCEIFALALKKASSAILLVHNHSSGLLIPSVADKELTNKVKVFGEMIGVRLLDHLIINSEKEYYSFADEGQLDNNKIPY